MLIAGGTGSGKTTLLNAMSSAISESERIITIEDAAELRLDQAHVLRLEARPKNVEGQGEIPIRELVKNSLRMRPDRIIVGEVPRPGVAGHVAGDEHRSRRIAEHKVHANTPRDALSRIESMVLMAGVDFPMRAIREQLSRALDLVVQIERFGDGSRKVTHITEVQRMESDVVTLQDVFEYQIDRTHTGGAGSLRYTGLRPTRPKFELHGIPLPKYMTAHEFGASAAAPLRPGLSSRRLGGR